MSWALGILAAVVTTAISLGAFSFFTRRWKLKEQLSSDELEFEQRRARDIVQQIGLLAVNLVQLCAGLAAGAPMFALLIWLGSGPSGLPKTGDLLFFAGSFVVGWVIFAWCLRVTEALKE